MKKVQSNSTSQYQNSENTTEPFANEEMNQEVRDMISLGLLDKNWARGLNEKDAEVKFNQVLSNGQDSKFSQAEPFANEEMNQEVRDMISLGLLDKNWARGLNEKDAEVKFNQVLSNGQDSKFSQAEPFANEEMNQEVRDMISLGLLDKNWARGLNEKDAEVKFNQVLSNGQDSKFSQAEPFANEEMNQEVRNMISLGLLDKNWARGLNEKDAEVKFNQVLSNGQDSKFSQAEPFANEEMNQEVRDMISLGLLDKNWACGLNEKEAEVKFNQILDSQNSATSSPKVLSHVKKENIHAKDKNSAKKKQYKLITLCRGDQTFQELFEDFKNCQIGKDIKTIQYVENEKQKRLFEEEVNQVKRLHGNEFDLQIKELYHATKAPRNLICSRGLDQRLSTVGLFGRGIYFADDVKKCEQYLYNAKGSAVYKCSVILGDIKEYPDGKADPDLKQEPEKENGDYYDSVKGNMDGFNEYIIYDNRRCLINYRIVLEGTEDEDSDKEDEIAKEEKKEEFIETWKRHMNYLVDSCKHDVEEDAEAEQEIRNIEKIRLEIRRRREMKTGKPLTKVSYGLLREERKKWKSSISKAENKTEMPSNQKSDEKKLPSNQKSEAEENVISLLDFNLDNSREEITHYPQVADDPQLANVMQSNHDSVLSRFIEITRCDDMDLAKFIVENQHFHLDNAVNEYLAFMS